MPTVYITVLSGLLLIPLLADAQLEVQPLLVQGEPVPGLPGESFGEPSRITSNNLGQVVILTTGPDRTLWATDGPGQSLVKLLKQGDPVPGLADVFFDNFDSQVIKLHENGVMNARIFLTGPGVEDTTRDAIFSIDISSGEIFMLAREGQNAPGTPYIYRQFTSGLPTSAQGETLFIARLEGIGESLRNALYLVAQAGATPTLVALPGDPAPGMGSDIKFGDLGRSLIEDGQVTFSATLEGPGIDESNDESLWYGSTSRGDQILLVREGDPAPGAAPGVVFGRFFSMKLLDDGRVAFMTELAGSRALYYSEPSTGTTTLIVKEGDAVSDVPGASLRFLQPQISRSGVFAALASMEGPGIDFENDQVVLQGDDLDVRVLAREGFELRAGLRVLLSYQIINDRGQLAIITRSADNTNPQLHAMSETGQLILVTQAGVQVSVAGVSRSIFDIPQLGYATRGSFDSFTSDGTLTFLAYLDSFEVLGVFTAKISDLLFKDGFEAD